MASSSAAQLCDTIPAARLAGPSSDSRTPSPPPTSTTFVVPTLDKSSVDSDWKPQRSQTANGHEDDHGEHDHAKGPAPSQPPARKLCVRHQRMADEGTNLKLQQALDALPVEEREAVNTVWQHFSSSPHRRRELILRGILTMCCFSQLSLLTDQLHQMIRIDPFAVLPREVGLKILSHLDATSLCRAAQVSRSWRNLADDDILWRGICEQHIGTKCTKCGWGLPVLERRRRVPMPSSPSPDSHAHSDTSAGKRKREDSPDPQQAKRHRAEASLSVPPAISSPRPTTPVSQPELSLIAPAPTAYSTRPWKDVYSERLKVERNWRRGRCSVRTLKGHTDGVMCLQFSETLNYPCFPILITGSYDRTVRVWNLETGDQMQEMRGHRRAVRALQFDEVKLVTGSMDGTLKVWNWRTGACVRTLEGHTEGVICLHFDADILASGSVDHTVKLWNFKTGECFTLRGHHDWVNAVQLWDAGAAYASVAATEPREPRPLCIEPGKMLFSASDDGTIRLWDLAARACVRTFRGHMGQVQSMRLMFPCTTEPTPPPAGHPGADAIVAEQTRAALPTLVSGSLDNTVKLWDVGTAQPVRTLFGHIEGVWAVGCDSMRLASGSHDRTIKVWSREDGRCTSTLVGHSGAVTCLALGEDKIVSGSDDGDVRVWSFAS
ncbi:unnamed protein product [Peniophora sp. CBMAI 1063]|nr:unnamed protein product [Peniophora sp. CBMAI 1063]